MKPPKILYETPPLFEYLQILLPHHKVSIRSKEALIPPPTLLVESPTPNVKKLTILAFSITNKTKTDTLG